MKFWISAIVSIMVLCMSGRSLLADYYKDGYDRYKEGKYDQAVKILNEGLNILPNDYNMTYLAGYCLIKMNKWAEATDQIKKAIQLKPESHEAHFLLGYIYMNHTENGVKQPDWVKAGTSFEEAALLKTDEFQYYYFWGLAKVKQQKYSDAIIPLKSAVQMKPDDFSAMFHLGYVHRKLSQCQEAQKVFEMALTLRDTDTNTWYYLCDCLLETKDYERLIATASKYAEKFPTESLAHVMLGKGYLMTNQYALAANSFMQVIALDPSYANAYFYLGQALVNDKQIDEGIKALDKATQLKSDDATWWVKLGNAYEIQKQWEQAKTAYEKALTLDTANSQARERLDVIIKAIP